VVSRSRNVELERIIPNQERVDLPTFQSGARDPKWKAAETTARQSRNRNRRIRGIRGKRTGRRSVLRVFRLFRGSYRWGNYSQAAANLIYCSAIQSSLFPGIPPNLHQTVLRAAPEPPRSLAVVPLIGDKRYYGETPMRVRWGSGGMSRKSEVRSPKSEVEEREGAEFLCRLRTTSTIAVQRTQRETGG